MVELAHLSKLDPRANTEIMPQCARYGYFTLLKWLYREKLCKITVDTCVEAIRYDRPVMLSYCCSSIMPNDSDSLGRIAAMRGNVEALQILKRHNLLTSSSKLMKMAAVFHGHKHVLDWLKNEYNPDIYPK